VCRAILLRSVLVILVATLLIGCRQETSKKTTTGQAVVAVQDAAQQGNPLRSGEELFKQYCSSCHPNGGNASDPGRPLYGSALRRNHITTPEDIVRIMRTPLSRMIRFDASTLPDSDARAIAEYILATFK